MTTLMASCSGLGAVPFFFLSSLSEEWAALANAVACGVMLAASFDLVHEGQPYGAAYTILGVILGGPLPPPLQSRPLSATQEFAVISLHGNADPWECWLLLSHQQNTHCQM